MARLIGRTPIELNIKELKDGHSPIYDGDRKLWTTTNTASYAVSASYVIGDAGITDWSEITNKPTVVSSSQQIVEGLVGQRITLTDVTASLQGTLDTPQITVNTNDSTVNTIISSSVKSGIFNATEIMDPPFPTNKYSGVLVEYVAQRDTALRAGNLYASWSGSTISYTDVSNADVGDTTDLSFNFIRVDNDILLRAYSSGIGSGEWTVQCLFKMFPNLI